MVCAPSNGQMTCTEGTKNKAKRMSGQDSRCHVIFNKLLVSGLCLSVYLLQDKHSVDGLNGLDGHICRGDPVLGQLLGPQFTLHLIISPAPAGHPDSQPSHIF